MKLKMKCNYCKQVRRPILERAGPHIKASCGGCGQYIKFVSAKTDARLRLYLAQEGVVHGRDKSSRPKGSLGHHDDNETEE